ncbi:anthranilate phosphoribosyltransferase [Timonella senegalensis]|uniref:anthranilate phosphoribosyltransferase n=1 Tax=Timonella senegalensis TaxID=1465825 RepID=UPI002FDE43A5
MTSPASFNWPDITATLIRGEDLAEDAAAWAMSSMMTGQASPVQLAGFLVALRAKGETVEELSGLATAMLAHAVEYPDLESSRKAVDIVGSGGDRLNTVNISTMASLVIAGCGIPVVKHGNRSSSSTSGSADVLEALGIPLDHKPARIAEIGRAVGITFCFAQTFHPAMRYAGPVRKDLGLPTAFNFLGPITNPGYPHATAVGVADEAMAPLVAGVFAKRGTDALVFRGALGLDELAAIGTVDVWTVFGGSITRQVLDPVADLGLPAITVEDIRGASAKFNAQVALDFLGGKAGPVRDTVVLNAAAALIADGSLEGTRQDSLVDSFKAAIRHAEDAVDSGRALAILDSWRTEATRAA